MNKKQLKSIFAAFIAAAAALTVTCAAACGPNDQTPDQGGEVVTPDEDPDEKPDEQPDEQPETPEGMFWNKVAEYSTGDSDAEGGVAEIVQYNEDNGKLYLVNGKTQTIDIATVEKYGEDELQTVFDENTNRIDIAELVKDNADQFADGFTAGDITSVAVNTELDIVAAAVQHSDYTADGAIVVLDYDGAFVAAYPAGVQPDMITFAGSVALTANEGEPRGGYGEGIADPMGSVTAVDLASDAPEATTITFEKFDAQRKKLVEDGVLLKKDTPPSLDLEPEYIAATDSTAYVALQEANAIAALDLETLEFEYIKGLGFKDHSVQGNGLDLLEDGQAKIETQDVLGVYMPDGLAVFEKDGKTYIASANEGDAREWGDYEDVEKYVIGDTKVEVLVNSEFDGLEEGKHYILGARSFSVWDAETMEQVFDSGDMIESYIAASEEYSPYFNCSNDDVELDSRSKKKGPEPEAVNVQTIDGRTYAFVALERQGGVMTFDITNFDDVTVAAYANSRDYSGDMLGDVAPESIDFIPAAQSPTGKNILIAANENSGTVALYAMESAPKQYEMHSVFTEAEEDQVTPADHLIIWSVYGNGGKDDGQTSNDFISIYNPTDRAVELEGYYVYYSTITDDNTLIEKVIGLTGTLEPGGTYVIIGQDTGNPDPLIYFAEGEYDTKFDTLVIDNKQYSVKLTYKYETTIDALGVIDGVQNQTGEGTPVSDINKHSVVIRKNAADTDNNAADFEVVDLRDVQNANDYKPVK